MRDSFKLHDYDMDGKIFAADVGAVIRAVPGLKPSQHEIEEIKAIMDQRGMSALQKRFHWLIICYSLEHVYGRTRIESDLYALLMLQVP